MLTRSSHNSETPASCGNRTGGVGHGDLGGFVTSNNITTRVCTACNKTLSLSFFAVNRSAPDGRRSKCRACVAIWNRRYLLERRFGLTPEDYDAMLSSQGGRCALCRADKPGGRWDRFHVDHCHETGRVRGLLCYFCNCALGTLGDSPEAIARVLAYVDPAREPIRLGDALPDVLAEMRRLQREREAR